MRRRFFSSGSKAEFNTNNYLTILALEDGLTASLSINACEYCIDGDGNWIALAADTATQSVNMGQTISFRGELSPATSNGIGTFTINKKCNLEGNCMSMLFGDDAIHNDSLAGYDYAFYKLFYKQKTINSISSDFLPATTLSIACYAHMFSYCSTKNSPNLPALNLEASCYTAMFAFSSIVTPPEELPATELARTCYYQMFRNSNLNIAPKLPATELKDYCYCYMFYGCASLKEAPVLPAPILVNYCYSEMLKGCINLNYIRMLATDTSANNCLMQWVYNVASTGIFVKHPNMKSLPTGHSGIPSGWTVQDGIIITECTSLSITADDVSGRVTQTTIYYTAVVNGIDDSGNKYTGINITGEAMSEEFPQNTSTIDTVTRTISYTYMGVTATTTITQGVWMNQGYILDLNNQWQVSSVTNPDSTLYDGVYESFSNKGVHNTAAIMYIDIVGYTDFSLYIRSYAESNYDYVMVSQLDQTISNSTSYSNTALVKAHTRGSQTSSTAIGNYKLVEFTGIDEGEHRITVLYRKDSSSNSGDDRGYVLIEKSQTSDGDNGSVGGGTIITFTIDGVEYQAEEGMTWEEWVVSNYDNESYYIYSYNDYYYLIRSRTSGKNVELNGVFVNPSDLIIADTSYSLDFSGGSGGTDD